MDKRIAYYVNKVDQFGRDLVSQKKVNKFRHKRLMQYKKIVYKNI